MARDILYVANFNEATDLNAVFGEFGAVVDVIPAENTKFDIPAALVTMAVEKEATKAMHTLNGQEFDGQRLYISYPTPDPKYYLQGLSKKARKTAESVVKELEEEYRKPVRRIHTMVLVCGHSFTLAVLDEARQVHAGEGMLVNDGSRKRTLGGVFFQLANRYYSPTMFWLIHNRGGKLPEYEKSDDRQIYHLIVNPHEEDVEEA